VHLQAAQLHVGQFASGAGVEFGNLIEVDAELVLGLASGDVLVGLRVHVRVHAHGGGRNDSEIAGDFVEVAQLFLALDVEGVDTLLQRVLDFRAGLADAGESAFARVAAGLDHAEEFAGGDDVEARVFRHQQLQHGEIGVRLHGVGDLVVDLAEGGIQAPVVVADRVCRVDVEGGAVLIGEGLEIDVLAVQRAIPVGKSVHARRVDAPRPARKGDAASFADDGSLDFRPSVVRVPM
jgi:hypothetical protein